MIFTFVISSFGGEQTSDIAKAKTLSVELSKPILIDFMTDWWGSCKTFSREANSDDALTQPLNSVILLTVDCEKNDGPELAKSFGVRGYPTFILVNAETQTLHRWIGYEKDFFITSLEAGLADPTTIEEKITRFKTSPDAATAEALASYHDSKGEYSDAVVYFKKAAGLNEDKSKDYAFDIFQAYYYGNRRKLFSFEELKIAANNALSSQSVKTEEKGRIYYYMSNMITNNKDDQDLVDFLKKGQAFFTKLTDDKVQRQKDNINILHTIYLDKDPAKAVKLKKAGMAEGWDESAKDINSFSWWCFEHKINLDEAEKLARTGVELAEPGGEKAMILDTVAEIVNFNGNPKEAIEFTKLAVKESPERKFYQDQLKRFEKLAE